MKGIRNSLRLARRLFVITIYMFSSTAALATDSSEIGQVVYRQIKPIMDEHDIPGMAVAVTVDGEKYFFNYGKASIDTQTPVTQDTLFEIGSLSKIFTSMLGMYAVTVGKLSLDDQPAKYMPELAGSPLNQATLLNLATYTAGGLPLQFPDSVHTKADIPSYFAQFSPTAAPGEQRLYSNPSIGLFGHLTALALGGDYPDLAQKVLFQPLGLDSTYIEVPRIVMKDYAWGYGKDNRPVRVNPGVFDAQAYGVKSSAADLIRLVEANISPDGFEESMQQTIKATQTGYFNVGQMKQGIGWESYPYPLTLDQLLIGNSRDMAMKAHRVSEQTPPFISSEPTLFNKTGSTNGFGAYVAFVPNRKIGIVLLANKNYPISARVKAAHTILAELH